MWCKTQASSHNAKSVIDRLVNERVWALRHQTSEQYSAAEYSKARVAVSKDVAPAPQVNLANRRKSPKRVLNFLRSELKCRRNVSALSNFMSRYVGSAQKVSIINFIFKQ